MSCCVEFFESIAQDQIDRFVGREPREGFKKVMADTFTANKPRPVRL